MICRWLLFFALRFGVPIVPAAIIGTNPPALPVNARRIADMESGAQGVWTEYLNRSSRESKRDQSAFLAEMKSNGIKQSLPPPAGHSASALRLREAAAWYKSEEAQRIAEIVASFQTPAGGWSKNLDMTQHKRAVGELFVGSNTSIRLNDRDYDLPRDLEWNYVGTFDNDATTTQLRYLAKVIASLGPVASKVYRASFQRGLDYIFASQFPNGGWPQVWPLQGGYHDAITFNDDAMISVLELLTQVARGKEEFAWVEEGARARATAAVQRGIECILDAQIAVAGRRTVWCQQHDPVTLKACSARNYEMPSQCSSESAAIIMFLMKQPKPSPKVIAAVHAAAAWFEKAKLRDVEFKAIGNDGRQLVPAPGKGPIWARYYQIGTDRPIFGDRDKTIHDDVNEISKERRNGYSWFGERPKRALEEYARWSEGHPKSKVSGN